MLDMLKLTEALLREVTLATLQSMLQGMLFQPGDPGYAEACMMWNGPIDKCPALIIQCASAADVHHALRFARTNALPMSIRGSGDSTLEHDVAGVGVLIDMSHMQHITVEPVLAALRHSPTDCML